MKIIDYTSKGGKNLILDYIDHIDNRSINKIMFIRDSIEMYGIDAF